MKRQGCLFLILIFLISLQAEAAALPKASREYESTTFTNNSLYKDFIVYPSFLAEGVTFFRARLDEDHVYLDWGIQGDLNTSSFIIERKTRGTGFRTIGGIKEWGESAFNREYSFKDELITDARPYRQYRLKQIFNDGSFTYHKTITVHTHPFHDIRIQQEAGALNLVLPKTEAGNYKVSIYNTSGLLLDHKHVISTPSHASSVSFNLNEFSPGLLVLIVEAGEDTWIEKVIKN